MKKRPSPSALASYVREHFAPPPPPSAEQYLETIELLRLEKFTWREIAAWLTKNDVPATHNQVYHAFKEKWGSEEDFLHHLAEMKRVEEEMRYGDEDESPNFDEEPPDFDEEPPNFDDEDNPDFRAKVIDGYDPDA